MGYSTWGRKESDMTERLHFSSPDSPGKNTGVGYRFLLQGIFLTQGSNPSLLHCRQTLYCLSHQGTPRCWAPSVHPQQVPWAGGSLHVKHQALMLPWREGFRGHLGLCGTFSPTWTGAAHQLSLPLNTTRFPVRLDPGAC